MSWNDNQVNPAALSENKKGRKFLKCVLCSHCTGRNIEIEYCKYIIFPEIKVVCWNLGVTRSGVLLSPLYVGFTVEDVPGGNNNKFGSLK